MQEGRGSINGGNKGGDTYNDLCYRNGSSWIIGGIVLA
jgi:hypothetical protein